MIDPELLEIDGGVRVRHWPALGSDRAVVCVGGVGGGFDSPADGLYPWLGATVAGAGTGAVVQVAFRRAGDLDASVADCGGALRFLEERGATVLAVVGHSFGGAVAIQAAAGDEAVRTVVTLATQGYGTDAVVELGDRCSLLAVHGAHDEVLSDVCSRRVAAAHGGRSRLAVVDAGHVLDEVADELREVVLAWLVAELA